LPVVFGVCELGVGGAVYRIPHVCWGEASSSDSSVFFNGAYDESPLSCVGGRGCRRCLLGLGVDAWSLGVVPFSGWCEPEAVQVDACGRDGRPGLFDGDVGGGGVGGCGVALVACCGGVGVVVVVGWSL